MLDRILISAIFVVILGTAILVLGPRTPQLSTPQLSTPQFEGEEAHKADISTHRRVPPQITFGRQLPAGVMREAIEAARREPRCAECMRWTMTKRRGADGHFVPDLIFNNGQEIAPVTMGDFSKRPPRGGYDGNQ